MGKSLDAMVEKKPAGASSEKEDAAQDLLDAVKEDDAKGVALAFARMYELCADEHAEPDDEEPEPAYGEED